MENQSSLSLFEPSFSHIASVIAMRKLLSKYSPEQLPKFDERFGEIYKGMINSQINTMRNTMVPEVLRTVFDEDFKSYYEKLLPLLEKVLELNN